MVTYNDTRFTYNNEWLTYNWLQFLELDDTQSSLDELLGYINFNKSDTQSQDEYTYLLRLLSLLVSDIATSSENKTLSIEWLNTDTIITQETKLLNINSNNTDSSNTDDDSSTVRILLISVNDEQSTTDNTVFNLWLYNADIQSLTDNSLNSITLEKQDTVSMSDLKIIEVLLKNVDIVYTTETSSAIKLLLSKIKPSVIWINRQTPRTINAIKHSPKAQ